MESVQKQILVLSAKIDALHHAVEDLSAKLADTSPPAALGSTNPVLDGLNQAYSAQGWSHLNMEHKDVLADENRLDTPFQSGDGSISPEIQIQRLTAQLTAAYNRIAALEEHLLAQRIP